MNVHWFGQYPILAIRSVQCINSVWCSLWRRRGEGGADLPYIRWLDVGQWFKTAPETFICDNKKLFLSGWAKTATGFLGRWLMPQASQCLRGFWAMPLKHALLLAGPGQRAGVDIIVEPSHSWWTILIYLIVNLVKVFSFRKTVKYLPSI